ncbi:MAG: hypothetical protein GX804_01340 [Lentisphaerae bacterium]|nr:hypothetical protein [Lentisphaerota bacterium]
MRRKHLLNTFAAAALRIFMLLTLGVMMTLETKADISEEYPDFYTGAEGTNTKGINFVQSITVLAPEYCSSVMGDFTVVFKAPGMKYIKAFCWRQPTDKNPGKWGHDAVLADMELKEGEMGKFVVKGDEFPNGPMTIRIHAKDDKNKQDICELQLYNLGGVKWNQGIPDRDPPGAAGMARVFADDFDGPLSISPDGMNARYAAHKTGGGDFSGWQFSDPHGENQPFAQRDTFLRIHASKPLGTQGRSGILSSLRPDGTGVAVSIPSYFECRFVAQSAPGTWPAFWTLTKNTIGMDKNDPTFEKISKMGSDELDIVEAYGGYGHKNPNSGGVYSSVSHFWGQPKPDWNQRKLADGSENTDFKPSSFRTDTLQLGGKSSWSWTFHTYGLAITETDTIYYFDDIEIGRHPTGEVSKALPAWFLINYSIGGISGWQIDMERYGNKTDMWVDFVRVYSGCVQAPEVSASGFPGAKPAVVTMSASTRGAEIRYTLDGSEPSEKSTLYTSPVSVSQPCTIKVRGFGKNLKPSPVTEYILTTPPGVQGSIGINFVTDMADSEQALAPGDVTGIAPYIQGNWNNVLAGTKTTSRFSTSDGATSPVTLNIEGEAKPEKGEPWGFSGNDRRLKRGNLVSNPRFTLAGIPYAKYDVVVILGAGIHNVQGEIHLAEAESGNHIDAFSFDYGWNGGQHAIATTKPGEAAKNTNYIVFRNVTQKDITITMKWGSGKGWTGVAAIQIVPQKD